MSSATLTRPATLLATRAGRLCEMYVLLVARDLSARYKSSVFGWLWPLLIQLSQLLVFTYLFATIFHVRLAVGGLPNDALGYGLWLFTGLVAYNAVQVGVIGSASAIYGQVNLVKRVVFPLELLPLVPVGTAFVESLFGLSVLIVLSAATAHSLHATLLLVPLIWLPQLLLTAGLAYFVAALSVFLRDVPQSLGPIFLLVFYLTPIVYPASNVPKRIAGLLIITLSPASSTHFASSFWRERFRACRTTRSPASLAPLFLWPECAFSNAFDPRLRTTCRRGRLRDKALAGLQTLSATQPPRRTASACTLSRSDDAGKHGPRAARFGGRSRRSCRDHRAKREREEHAFAAYRRRARADHRNDRNAWRISALLELGSGFNPEFTGRENVYFNGMVLGLTRSEIDARYDDIAAFADIGASIDRPVKTYSSGMFVRLAFAVATSVEPDILIVDEALAVGDVYFQQKCFERISTMREQGITLFFVSHNSGAVYRFCDRAILLEHGVVALDGLPKAVIETYEAHILDERDGVVVPEPVLGVEPSNEI